jgi:hypothetical protein
VDLVDYQRLDLKLPVRNQAFSLLYQSKNLQQQTGILRMLMMHKLQLMKMPLLKNNILNIQLTKLQLILMRLKR